MRVTVARPGRVGKLQFGYLTDSGVSIREKSKSHCLNIGGNGDHGPVPAVVLVFHLTIVVLLLASYWWVFIKAGQPG